MQDLAPGIPIAAIDVGGTTIKAARVDAEGRIHRLAPMPTPLGAEAVAAAAAQALRELRALDPLIAAAGVVVPGVVDAEHGIAVLSENLRWQDAPLRAMIAEASGLPVALDHDVRAAVRMEQRTTGERDLAVLVIGTGIAAGIVVDGRMLVAGGAAGEIGHSIVVEGGAECVCGSRGCLEAVASAAAIARRYSEAGEPVAGASAVLERAERGDPIAKRVWAEAVDALAVSVRQLVAIAGTTSIAIAGGLSLAGDALLVPLRDRVAATLTLQEVPTLRIAGIGADGGLLGAIDIARELARQEQP